MLADLTVIVCARSFQITPEIRTKKINKVALRKVIEGAGWVLPWLARKT